MKGDELIAGGPGLDPLSPSLRVMIPMQNKPVLVLSFEGLLAISIVTLMGIISKWKLHRPCSHSLPNQTPIHSRIRRHRQEKK
jgi:hypothetical protein